MRKIKFRGWDIKFIEYSCWEVIGNIYENKELLEV